MRTTIRLPTPLRAYAEGQTDLVVDAATVSDALAQLTVRYPKLRSHLFGEDGALRNFVNVFLNQEALRQLEGEPAVLKDGDTITLVPSVAGGGGSTTRAELTPEEVFRYSRHLIMPEVGMQGQRKLKAARVLLVGAGGLGSPLGLYLAAAGVGTLGVVDFDVVEVTNLQRQVLYGEGTIGQPKLEAAAERPSLIRLHPEGSMR